MSARHGLYVAGVAGAGVSQPQDARLVEAGLLSAVGAGPLDAVGGIIHGPGNPCNVTGSSSGPSMKYSISAGVLATARGTSADGLTVWVNDGALLVDSGAPAPGSGSRYDVIYALHKNANDGFGDANSDPLFGVTVGTSGASPAVPAVPAGALALAQALVGTSIANASLATVTMLAPYKVARGAPVPVRSQAERDALTQYDGLRVVRLDTNITESSDGATWTSPLTPITRAWSATARAGTSDNFTVNTRTQLQSLTFTGPAGTYQVVSRQSISASVSGAGLIWVTASGVDVVSGSRGDTQVAGARNLFTTVAPGYVHSGGSLTVAHAHNTTAGTGTVWNGSATALDVFYLGP